MNLHIVLDVNVVLDLLLKRPPAANEKSRLFSELKKSGAIFYVALCSLPSLEYIHAREVARLIKEGNLKTEMSPRVFAKKQLDTFLEKIHIISSPGFTWNEIPADHPDREDALIGLSAGLLPEPVYLWTNDGDFDPVAKGVMVINEVSGAALLNNQETTSLPFIDLFSQQTRVGINGRLDTLQAAILLEKFTLFPEECDLRSQAGKHYDTLLADIPGIQPPMIATGNTSVYAQYTILSPDREHLSQSLKQSGIPSVAYYTAPLHLQGAFADLGHKAGDFPVAEKVAAQCLNLPMSPYLTMKEQEKVADAIKG